MVSPSYKDGLTVFSKAKPRVTLRVKGKQNSVYQVFCYTSQLENATRNILRHTVTEITQLQWERRQN